ncbi:PadR family transcriptional regulator [Microbacterium sp. YMB-B2]|uniref:PadR family transcriptional regulator n=1 Tax=Microbacterium tenebrionis TaxID=2830665 RepID=A0A9X1LMR0_9MICO|nr:PadR family transcriptional regulator [Microbacterium tenebrionis]MCC2028594.1 PadR family transcriptional regulator [Microbacterium tenebrionis]
MNSSDHSGGFGSGSPFGGFGSGGSGFGSGGPGGLGGFGGAGASVLFDAVDQLRRAFDQRPANSPRMPRGDVRAAVLSLLSDEPMHGYQIIREIEERSGGSWKPSAGSVYPTLQLLADEGLVEAEEQNGRKTYALTEAGRAVADEAEAPAAWKSAAGSGPGGSRGPEGAGDGIRFGGEKHRALVKAGVDLAGAATQFARSGSSAQIDSAIEVLDDARRKLYAILAQE